ncbi:MAG TPA: hypothetical protein VIV11_19270 [Kofleriaceae bacterium]
MRQGLYAFALFAAGCGYTPGTAERDDAGPDDARIDSPIDARIDTMMIDTMIDTPMAVDTDGDGVVDGSDNCPADANGNQRNHDMDAKGDVCDRCPHLNDNADPDGDNDGVGNACDPRPNTAGDSIALFEGFYDASSITTWTANGGTWVVANGTLNQSSTAATDVMLVAPLNLTRAAVTTAAHVNGFGTSSAGNLFTYPHVSVTAGVASGQGYWCSVLDDPGGGDKIYASTDWFGVSADYPEAPWPGTFAPGSDVRVTVAQVGSNNLCTVVQGGTSANVSGSMGPTTGAVQVQTRTAAASFDYFFVVSIP